MAVTHNVVLSANITERGYNTDDTRTRPGACIDEK